MIFFKKRSFCIHELRVMGKNQEIKLRQITEKKAKKI